MRCLQNTSKVATMARPNLLGGYFRKNEAEKRHPPAAWALLCKVATRFRCMCASIIPLRYLSRPAHFNDHSTPRNPTPLPWPIVFLFNRPRDDDNDRSTVATLQSLIVHLVVDERAKLIFETIVFYANLHLAQRYRDLPGFLSFF